MKGWLEKGQMFETSPKVEQVRYKGKSPYWGKSLVCLNKSMMD